MVTNYETEIRIAKKRQGDSANANANRNEHAGQKQHMQALMAHQTLCSTKEKQYENMNKKAERNCETDKMKILINEQREATESVSVPGHYYAISVDFFLVLKGLRQKSKACHSRLGHPACYDPPYKRPRTPFFWGSSCL